ncbi:unnamed protein product [Cunninghamella blakesleeana]
MVKFLRLVSVIFTSIALVHCAPTNSADMMKRYNVPGDGFVGVSLSTAAEPIVDTAREITNGD